jgi:hypothetical protein
MTAYPETTFMVISDPHFYEPSLGTSGAAFTDYLEKDRKLLAESEAILQTAIGRIQEHHPDFLLIPGDLTKDGALISHTQCAGHLASVEKQGIQVYVVPGNHDILNPHAMSFSGDRTERVETVTPEEFRTIYSEFGYSEALYQDPNSLSYVVEPVQGLWLFALDSALYGNNIEEGEPETDGGFTQQQITWIETKLVEALQKGKVPIAMFHHGVIEHYDSQKQYFDMYLIDEFRQIADMFSFYKVPAVFTGHYHAQDIVLREWEEEQRFLYDIETGSLVTFPCPYRLISIKKDGIMDIDSFTIDDVPGLDTGEKPFEQYARDFIYRGINGIAIETMKELGIKEEEAAGLAPQITDAFIAHYLGDEQFTWEEMLSTEGLGLLGRLVVSVRKKLVHGLWDDPPPPDNRLRINIKTGAWEEIQ